MISYHKPTITRAELESALGTLVAYDLAPGKQVKQFETLCADYIEVKYALGVNSGAAAFHLALTGMGVGAGDEVIIPSYTKPAILSARQVMQFIPKLVDSAEGHFYPDIEKVKAALTEKTKAVVMPHTLGVPTPLDAFRELEVPILEDITMALGARYNDKPVAVLVTRRWRCLMRTI